METQHFKCAFCERVLESREYGRVEHDLEHFRPKLSVPIWPDPSVHSVRFPFNTGQAFKVGYYWLAYDLENYLASCKPCNTSLKNSYFPIEGRRSRREGGQTALRSEKPFLCYPLGFSDEDPEKLITFVGTVARPVTSRGRRYRRARVIIEFFDLNGREGIHEQRAMGLVLLGTFLEKTNKTIDESALIDRLTSPQSPHTGCCRAFKKLWYRDQNEAVRILTGCKRFLVSKDIADLPN